jgi:hypothetical protein
MWDDWNSKLGPDRRIYWRMVDKIELTVLLTRNRHSEGDEWNASLEAYATLADSDGPIWAEHFKTIEAAETAAFRAACERIKLIRTI